MAGAWGFGATVLARFGAPARRDAWLEGAIATTLGVGLFIVAFQALAIAGALRQGAVLALLGAGIVLALLRLPGWRRELKARAALAPAQPAATLGEKCAFAALLLVGLPTLFSPLAPPVAFDEVMYHLPYARQVAQSGTLGVYEWLRYPWFPYNYDLLYAAALTVYDDVFTHFIHGLAGWLSVLMIHRLGRLHANRYIACLGAGIWLALGDYPNSYIDMGVALFVLAAFVALWWWDEGHVLEPAPGAARHGRARWLLLAAFFLGVAAGSKYQALIFLPLVAVFVARRERRPLPWLAALALFLVPCIYWYARNYLQTGDPFNPIGARVFGFTNWNMADYTQQLADVRDHANMPNGLFWPLLLVPFSPLWRPGPVRAAFVFCIYSLVIWVATSRYPRYMMASFPLLALMAAVGWYTLLGWAGSFVRRRLPALARGRTPGVFGGLLMVVLAGFALAHSVRDVRMISPTPASREAFLARHVPGYEVLSHLRANPVGRLYQVGLNDSIYFAPNPVWGDIFGPFRYSDYLYLPADQLARKLASQQFGSIVIQTALAPYVHTKPDFDKYFSLIVEKDGVKAYRILAPTP
ncbi:ArnT family glycosyltransferase [Variovorax sp.]|uniref:ArnT family glycosyltransferase n=1 Tax=Variovorax sp. TaxID=1871043 RepID=UPI0037D9A273